MVQKTEANSVPSKTSKMELFAKIINDFHSSTIFSKMIFHRCFNFSLQLYKNRSHSWLFCRFLPTFQEHVFEETLHWTITFLLKSWFHPLQMRPSQNDNKISKCTIEELNLSSYVHCEQVNAPAVHPRE